MADINKIFNAMMERFSPEKAQGMNTSIMFDLSGEDGGQWTVQINDGKASFEKEAADNPTATIKMAAEDYAKMTKGELNAMTAFMTGKIKVDGDLNSVMKFQSLFGM